MRHDVLSNLRRYGRRRSPATGIPDRRVFQRRLLVEHLEDRRVLSVASPQIELFSTSPALFVQNQGQWADESVRFLHNGNGVNVAMTDSGPVFQVVRREVIEDDSGYDEGVFDPDADLPGDVWPGGFAGSRPEQFNVDQYRTETLAFSASFVGAAQVEPVGLQQSETVFNYFVGDQANWRSEVPSYEVVAYEGLYEGIDLHTWGLRSSLKYEFHVAPGADWSQIAVRYDGIEGLSLADDGSLVIDLGGDWGELVDAAPYIYQVIDGKEVEVAGHFSLAGIASYSFVLSGDYDPQMELIIDPYVDWLQYYDGTDIGGGFLHSCNGMALDADGTVWVTGHSHTYDGVDAFVAKIAGDGRVLWSSSLGDYGYDSGYDVAADDSGSAYVTGEADTSPFVARVNSTGKLLWLRNPGIFGYAVPVGVVADASGNAYIAGNNHDWLNMSSSVPFVLKMNADGATLWTRYLESQPDDYTVKAVAIRDAGNVWVSGLTNTQHAFIAEVSNDGTLLRLHDQLDPSGGAGVDWVLDMALDGSGHVFVAMRAGAISRVVMYTMSGEQVWEWIDPFWLVAIAVDRAGEVVIAAHSDTGGLEPVEKRVFKLSNGGKVLWMCDINNQPESGVGKIAVGSSGDVFFSGFARGSVVIGKIVVDSDDKIGLAVDFGVLAEEPLFIARRIGDSPWGAKDVDLYRFTLATAANVTLDVDAQSIGSSLDAYLRLFNSAGSELASNDDHDGRDPYLSRSLAAGTYYVGVSGRPNNSYNPADTGNRNSSSTAGPYHLKLMTSGNVPPSETVRTVGQLTIRAASFSQNSQGQWVAEGEIWIGDSGQDYLVQVVGSLKFDGSHVWVNGSLWMRNLPVLNDVELYKGSLHFNASQAATDGLNELLSGLKVVGLDMRVSRVWFAQGQVRLQGRMVLPAALGGVYVTVGGSDYIALSPSGLTFSGATISIPDAKNLTFFGIPFQNTGVLLQVSPTEIQVRGKLTLPSTLGGTTIDLLTDERHLSITRQSDGRPKLEVVGSLAIAGPVTVGTGFELSNLLFQVDTTTGELRGDGKLKVPAGFTIDIGLGFKNEWFDYVRAGVSNLNKPVVVVHGVPVVYLQDVGGYLEHLAPGPPPVVLGGSMAFTAGPEVTVSGQTYSLLRLNLAAKYDTAGRFTGTGQVLVGGGDDPFEFATAQVIIDKDYGLYAAGQMKWGDASTGSITIDGALKWGLDRTLIGALIGVVRTPNWFSDRGEGWELASATAYVQHIWDSNDDNDYVVVGGTVLGKKRAVSVNLNTGEADWWANYSLLASITIEPPSPAPAFAFSAQTDGNGTEHELLLPGGLEAALFSVEWDEGDTEVHIVDPLGFVYTPENVGEHPDVGYYKNPAGGEAYYEVFNPAGGSWRVVVTNAGGIGGYTVQSRRRTEAPVMTLLEPAQDVDAGPVTISWVAEPGDLDASINLYYDTDRQGADGTLIASGIAAVAGLGDYSWDTADLSTGEYFVYAVISDGTNLPTISYATGRVDVVAADAPAAPTGLTAWAGTETTAELSWDAVAGAEFYLVYLTDDAAGEFYQQVLAAADGQLNLTGLIEGQAYRVAVATVDAEGRVGPRGVPGIVVAGSEYTSTTGDGRWDVFIQPGELYEAPLVLNAGDIPTLVTAPAGATLDGVGLFRWPVPGEANGWYEVVVHVTSADGEMRGYRYQLLADSDAPEWGPGTLVGEGIAADAVRVTAPGGRDVSGVLQYQWERDGVELPEWWLGPEIVDTGLQPNGTYEYRVRMRDRSPSGQISEWSDSVWVTTQAEVPGAPVLGAATPTTVELLQLAFDGNPGGTEYAVFNATTEQWLAEDGAPSALPVWQTAPNWNDCTVSGLYEDRAYVFQVMARNVELVESELGADAVVYTTPEVDPPSVLTAVYNNGTTTVTIEFSEPVLIGKKDIHVTDRGGQPVDLSAAGFSHTPGDSTVILDFSGVLEPDSYALVVSGSTMQDLAGNFLDGDRDGIAGGDFELSFSVWALTATPNPVARPAAVTLLVTGIGDPGGDVVAAAFYRDTNRDGHWDETDDLLGTDADSSDGWSWTLTTAGWELGEHTFFARVQDDEGAWSEAAAVSLTVTSWQNPENPFDVGADGTVDSLDVLFLVNEINRNESPTLPPRAAEHQHLPYYDVNADGLLTPLDVLLVVNHINLASNPPGAPNDSGEGESATEWAYSGQMPLSPMTVSIPDRPETLWSSKPDDAKVVQTARAVLVQRVFEMQGLLDLERELPDWEKLLDDRPMDDADLDAYFREMD